MYKMFSINRPCCYFNAPCVAKDVTTIARTRGSLNTALLVGAENISQSLLIVVLYTQTKFTWNIIIVDDCAALKLNKKQFLSGTREDSNIHSNDQSENDKTSLKIPKG